MKANNENDNKCYKAAEVKLMYMTEIKSSERIRIRNSEDAAAVFFDVWDFHSIEHTEEVKMIMLNRANKVLGIATLSKGGLNGSIMDTRVILQYAIKSNATAVILAHNHPSGNLEASESDQIITTKVKEALELVEIKLLDHLILNKDEEFATIE